MSAIDFSNKETDKPFLLVGFFQVQLSRNGTVVLISIKAFCWPVNELRFGSIKKKEKSNRCEVVMEDMRGAKKKPK